MPNQRTLRLTLGYRGSAYAGWASQPGQPTVQGVLEGALQQALGHVVRTTAAGRTDTGVHADAQVVSFATTSTMPAPALVRTLPQWLPEDIWVSAAADADPTFDARRSARRRWYQYVIWRGNAVASVWQGRALALHEALDFGAMRRAAGTLLGEHDFAAVATEPTAGRSTRRTVFAADWLSLGSLAVFEICADAYLKQMVRGIVGTLLQVGRGIWTVEHFSAALATADRRATGPNAPALGLTLARIDY